jgi:hypothetical protein
LNKGLLALLAGALAVALVIAGCGSSSDSSTTASLSKAEFVKQGNAICKAGNKEIEEGFEEFTKENNLSKTKPPSKAIQEEAAETILIPAINNQVEEIRALGTPEGDEGEVDEILTDAEEAVEESEEDPTSLLGAEPAKFKELNKESREYGLTVCGEGEGEEEGK